MLSSAITIYPRDAEGEINRAFKEYCSLIPQGAGLKEFVRDLKTIVQMHF